MDVLLIGGAGLVCSIPFLFIVIELFKIYKMYTQYKKEKRMKVIEAL